MTILEDRFVAVNQIIQVGSCVSIFINRNHFCT